MTLEERRIKAIELYQKRAEDLRMSAAYNGAYNDGGASHMLELANAFMDGVLGKTPKWLEPYMREVQKQVDPEYAEYERLKKKFGA